MEPAVPPGSDDTGESTPGVGGVVQQPTNDVALEQQALRNGWGVSRRYREAMVQRQIRIALDPESTARDATRAFVAVRAGDPEFIAMTKPQNVNAVQVNNNIGPMVLNVIEEVVTDRGDDERGTDTDTPEAEVVLQ